MRAPRAKGLGVYAVARRADRLAALARETGAREPLDALYAEQPRLARVEGPLRRHALLGAC